MSEKEPVSPQADAPVDAPVGKEDVIDEPQAALEPLDDGDVDLPGGWKYKRMSLFGSQFWYASPKVQLLMVSFVCFMCPGMFNALGGLGGGGKINPTLADNMVSNYTLFLFWSSLVFGI